MQHENVLFLMKKLRKSAIWCHTTQTLLVTVCHDGSQFLLSETMVFHEVAHLTPAIPVEVVACVVPEEVGKFFPYRWSWT